jgi:riboflavin-specific deaminase-like protein
MRSRGAPARPFVTANFAITADGRISTRNFTPSDFSSRRDKRRLLEIRAACDAVLVGARTLAADSMTLGIPAADLRDARRKAGLPELPLRVIVSSSGRIDPALRIFREPAAPILIFSTTRMPSRTRTALAAKAHLHLHESPTVDLQRTLATLRRGHGIRRLVCEGGGELFRSLLQAGLVDELHLTLCPRLFGGSGAPTLTGVASRFLPRSTRVRLEEMLVSDRECFTRWKVLR